MAGRLAAEGRSIPFEADSVRLSAGYGDVAAFHGGRYPAGAVLGFKLPRSEERPCRERV